MPIGKNAIKRVENNGYSNVVTSAPDMDNSVIAEELPAKEAPAVKKRTVKKAVNKKNNGLVRYEVGSELPYWLL